MTPAEVFGLIATVSGGLFGAWQWMEKQQATRRKEEAQREADREKAERESVEFAFMKLQGIITQLEATNGRAMERLDAAESRHQEDRAEHAKCREELAGLKQTAEWQKTEIAELRQRIGRLEGGA